MAHFWQGLQSGDWLKPARARAYSLILLGLCAIAIAFAWLTLNVMQRRELLGQPPDVPRDIFVLTGGLCSMTDDDRLRRVGLAIWATIGLIGLVVIGATFVTTLRIEWHSFRVSVSCGMLLAAAGWFYRSVRSEPRLGAVLTSTSQIIGFAAVGAPLSYLAATAGFPLQDALFDAWDRQWLHLDWSYFVFFIAARPNLGVVLLIAYSSFAVQAVTTVFALGAAGQFVRLTTFIVAFISTTLITIALSAVLPAAGPWLFLDLHPAMANGFLPTSSTSWPVFLGLRDGTFHIIHGINSEGIITFPSLHAAFAILFAAALWRVSGVRWAALVINGAMLVATPAYGSHYFVDVIAGTIVAVLCWIAAARMLNISQARAEHVADIPLSPSIQPDIDSRLPEVARHADAEAVPHTVANV